MEFVLAPVIPAKAGIQRVSDKFATGNQVQIAVSGSLLPLWEKARMRVSRASSPRRRQARPPYASAAKSILFDRRIRGLWAPPHYSLLSLLS